MKKLILFTFILFFALTDQQAQEVTDTGGFAFGIKGGPSLGTQKYSSGSREVLFAPHVIGFIESLPVDGKFALFAQAGLHVRGSAFRNQRFTSANNGSFFNASREFKYRNIALSLGAKQIRPLDENNSFYYFIGLRGEYTVNTNLLTFEELLDPDNNTFSSLSFPVDDSVRKWNYGGILGGGIEFSISEFIGLIVELSINPDFSFQYRQPQITLSGGTSTALTVQEQFIKNNTLELSVGLRFQRIVEYID